MENREKGWVGDGLDFLAQKSPWAKQAQRSALYSVLAATMYHCAMWDSGEEPPKIAALLPAQPCTASAAQHPHTAQAWSPSAYVT